MKHTLRLILLISFSFLKITISTAQINQDQQYLDSIHQKTKTRADSLVNMLTAIRDQLTAALDSITKLNLRSKIDSLDLELSQNRKDELASEFGFMRKYPSSELTLDILLYKIHRREAVPIYDSFYYYYNNLSDPQKKSSKGQKMKDELFYLANSSIGKSAPDFCLRDFNNEKLCLSSFKGRSFVLLDFWASWCQPCKSDLPELKNIYATFKNKGLEIIGVSTDKSPSKWREAINEDQISKWNHILLKDQLTDVQKQYFVSAIPVKILINKKGKIIGRWRGAAKEFMDDIAKLLEESL